MKYISLTLLAAIICVSTYGQNIKLTRDEIDDFTGNLIRITNNIVIGKDGVGNNVRAGMNRSKSDEFDLVFINITVYTDLGCLSEYNSYIMLKSGDEVISLPQYSDTDCGSDVMTARFF